MIKSIGLFLCASLFLALLCSPAAAQNTASPPCNLVYFFNAWATATDASSGAIYGLLVNLSSQPDTLLGATTDAAQTVELDTMSMDANGVMQMTPVDGGIPVAANAYTELQSGGLHLMLINLKQPLAAGGSIALTLHFEHAGDVQVSVPIQDTSTTANASGADMNMSGMSMPAAATPEATTPTIDWGAACQKVYVVGAWARASIPGAPNTVAYGLLLNLTNSADTLVGASSSVAQAAELHDTLIGQNGVMSMTPLPSGIAVPAGGAVLLQPGGMHIMLVGLKQSIDVGSTFDLTFTFAHAGSSTLTIPVLPIQDSSMNMTGM